jgi:hypothetical protein
VLSTRVENGQKTSKLRLKKRHTICIHEIEKHVNVFMVRKQSRARKYAEELQREVNKDTATPK